MNYRLDLTQERLKQMLRYDPETGVFTRIRANGTAKVGDVAGTRKPDGYRAISIDGRLYQANRLAWLYMTGDWPPELVDHRDRDPSNDRWANLRAATPSQNAGNSATKIRSISGVKGVHWNKAMRRWCAQVKVERKIAHTSYHTSIDSAADPRLAHSEGEAMNHWTFKTAFEQIEKCDFECEGGPLRNNVAWQWLRSVVKDPPDDRPRPRISDIKAIVNTHFKLAPGRLEGYEAVREVSIPRHIAYRLVRVHTLRSYPMIGREFGGRDHTTIINGIASISKRMRINPELRDAYNKINEQVDQLVLPNSNDDALDRNT